MSREYEIAKELNKRTHTIAVMVEIIKLRCDIKGIKATDDQIFQQAVKSFKKSEKSMLAKK